MPSGRFDRASHLERSLAKRGHCTALAGFCPLPCDAAPPNETGTGNRHRRDFEGRRRTVRRLMIVAQSNGHRPQRTASLFDQPPSLCRGRVLDPTRLRVEIGADPLALAVGKLARHEAARRWLEQIPHNACSAVSLGRAVTQGSPRARRLDSTGCSSR